MLSQKILHNTPIVALFLYCFIYNVKRSHTNPKIFLFISLILYIVLHAVRGEQIGLLGIHVKPEKGIVKNEINGLAEAYKDAAKAFGTDVSIYIYLDFQMEFRQHKLNY